MHSLLKNNFILILYLTLSSILTNSCAVENKKKVVNDSIIQSTTQTENEVDFWLTKADESVKIQKQETILGFGTLINNYATIEVDVSQVFQSVDGFGFSLTGGSAEVINQLATEKKARIID